RGHGIGADVRRGSHRQLGSIVSGAADAGGSGTVTARHGEIPGASGRRRQGQKLRPLEQRIRRLVVPDAKIRALQKPERRPAVQPRRVRTGFPLAAATIGERAAGQGGRLAAKKICAEDCRTTRKNQAGGTAKGKTTDGSPVEPD